MVNYCYKPNKHKKQNNKVSKVLFKDKLQNQTLDKEVQHLLLT